MPSNTAKRILLALLALAIASIACAFPVKNKIDILDLSTDLCKKPKVNITLSDRSTANNNDFSRTLMYSDEAVDILGRLSCVWEDPYQSAQTSGTIRAHLEVLILTDQGQAEILLYDLIRDNPEKIAYCKDIEDCTVTQESNTIGRYLYVEENITGLEEEKVLPSYHTGTLISWSKTSQGVLLINLFVDHPELESGSSFIKDTIDAVENYFIQNLTIIP